MKLLAMKMSWYKLDQGCTTFFYCQPHTFCLWSTATNELVWVIFMRYGQVPTNTEHIQTWIVYSFYNSLWHHHPDCYASCWLIFLPYVCFASTYASMAAKSYIFNHMWMAANFIIEGHMLDQRWANYGPQATCGPWGHFVWPAGQSHVHR